MNARILLLALLVTPLPLFGQTTTQQQPSAPTPPPATKLEGFRPQAGTIVTMGYDELGRVGTVSVDVRENRDANGAVVRGVVVDVRQSEYRQERAFVDADELPELIKGVDALLDVKSNPTRFTNFEVRYETKGELQVTAFNTSAGKISYVVKAGRVTVASAYNLNVDDLKKLRAMFVSANDVLNRP